jgi:phosphate starvation-inducible PhoH-like protein
VSNTDSISEFNTTSQDLFLEPVDNARLANLCGNLDEHLRQIEQRLSIEISNFGHQFQIIGEQNAVKVAISVIEALYHETEFETLNPLKVHLSLKEIDTYAPFEGVSLGADKLMLRTKRVLIRSRGSNQQRYIWNIKHHDINFGVGPAGTGKTYLAVACAVDALESNKSKRLILVRPAVEAGERLGFLPGDMAQKIDPYLRPLYDALYEMVGFDRIAKLIERNIIEIAPLAFMRGRTLNDSFIILDEAQNTTVEQMKMFLTRIGFGSVVVVTGDITQIDLPRNVQSGLRQVLQVLKNVDGISMTVFNAYDVVRHPLVQRIVSAYSQYEAEDNSS